MDAGEGGVIDNHNFLAERLTNELLMQTHFCQCVPCCQWQLVSTGELVHPEAVARLRAEGRLVEQGDSLGIVDGGWFDERSHEAHGASCSLWGSHRVGCNGAALRS
jgi:hypothetical protein